MTATTRTVFLLTALILGALLFSCHPLRAVQPNRTAVWRKLSCGLIPRKCPECKSLPGRRCRAHRSSCELSVGCPSGSDRGGWRLLRLQIPRENRMNVHKNARLTPHGRERIYGRL